MLKKERQLYIMQKIKEEGKVITNDLCSELNVAEDTIRKDFQELSAKGLVKRFHGGILSNDNTTLDTDSNKIEFNMRANLYADEKETLAKLAVNLLKDAKVLYIDNGTSNLSFAKNLPKDFKASVITNSPYTALELCKLDNVSINILSGELEKDSKAINGASTVNEIKELNIEYCLIGVSSLDLKCGISVPSFNESLLKKELFKRSKHVIAIATHNKLNTIATYYVADIDQLEYLITDEQDENILKPYRELGIKIINR